MTRILRISLGMVMVTLGVIGLIIPLIPGWIFLAPGLLVLTADVPSVGRGIRWVMNRSDRGRRLMSRICERARRYNWSHPVCSPESK